MTDDSLKPWRDGLRALRGDRPKTARRAKNPIAQTLLQQLLTSALVDSDGNTAPKADPAKLLANPATRHLLFNWLIQHSRRSHSAYDAGWNFDLNTQPAGDPATLTTSSSPDEIAHYRQQLEMRAAWLEAALAETLLELERIAPLHHDAGTTEPPP